MILPLRCRARRHPPSNRQTAWRLQRGCLCRGLCRTACSAGDERPCKDRCARRCSGKSWTSAGFRIHCGRSGGADWRGSTARRPAAFRYGPAEDAPGWRRRARGRRRLDRLLGRGRYDRARASERAGYRLQTAIFAGRRIDGNGYAGQQRRQHAVPVPVAAVLWCHVHAPPTRASFMIIFGW